ncbi:MAG: helix-turn-helix transcriptional regulator [Clostridia bacterium]|nr:helix-turn-helix transcriptional regulator [Clostridia bacterium]MBQ8289247.1 helix-turn-helix transcriptional regulator [Clostridia bacterium]
MIDYKIIGERIRELRIKKGYTQAYLAELSGIEPSNISHIERAATKLSLPTLVSIANALGATLDEIVYDNLEKSAHISQGEINSLLADCNDSELRALTEIIKTTKSILRKR